MSNFKFKRNLNRKRKRVITVTATDENGDKIKKHVLIIDKRFHPGG